MAAFNLTAEINLRGPSNLNRVVADIRRQLSTVSLNLNINQSATRNIQGATSQLQNLNNVLRSATANANSLNAALSNLSASIGNAATGMNNLGGGLNNVNNQINAVNRNTQQGAAGMEEFGRQAALAVRRFAAFSVATGGIYALIRAISSGYSEFLQFNKELVRLQQVTGGTANSLQGISNEITRLSTSLGVTSNDLLTVSSTLAQAGLSATETKTALEALAKSALAPSFDNLNDTVEGSIALMRQFGISANDLESSLGSVNAVAAAFAVESGDIIKAIQRTGGVFAAASKGVSQGKDALNEFVAVFTSVRQTTRESAETIATGLRTIFTRIQRGGTIQALKEYGIALTDLEGKFVGPFEAVRRLSEGLRSLDPRDLRFNQIVEELGGFRQIGKVIPLIQQFATAQQALGVAQRGAGSLAEAAATAQGSLAIKITKVREEFIALIRDIGQSDSFQKFVDISLQLASALISVASAAKNVLPALAALAAIRSIPAIGQFVGGFGRGLTRRNQGGPIRAFATGGFVPGSGNGDTVPAMLTPGEFVIRKNAVKSIGVNRLQKMNKYAGGGPVRLKDLEARSGSATIKNAYSSTIQPSDKISANINRKPQQVKPNDPRWENIQSIAKKRYAQLRAKNPKASDKKLKDIAAGDAFEDSIAKSTGGQKTAQSYPVDIIGKKNAIEAKFTSKKTPIMDLISKLFRHRYEQNTLGRYDFTPDVDPNVNIGSLDVMEMGSGQKKQFMKNYPFNMGGIVQRFAKGKGVKKLSPGLEKQVAAAGGFENLLTKNMLDSGGVYNFGLVSLKSGTSKGSRIENRPIGKTGKRARIHVGTLSDRSQYDDIESNIVSSLQGVITQTGSSLASFLGSSIIGGKQGKQILNGAVLSSATGSIFEAALQMIGAPYIDKIESLKSMDFPFGLGKASSLFGSIPSNVPTDATRTIGGTGKGISDFVNQIGRFLGAVDKKEFTKQLGSPAPNVFRALSQGGFSGQKAQKLNKLLQSNGIMVSVGSKPLKAAGKSQLEKGLTGSSPQLQQQILDEIASPYAKGGSIQDTVPALLTPGEFVINKKAAQRIGSAKLNKLNRADKIQGFNKGGAVGDIQSFASGGGVQRFFVGGAVRAFSGLISAVQQLTQRMSLLGRNIPSGGGWTGGTRLSRLTQGGVRDTSGGGMRSMGLIFIGPVIAEAINSSITKTMGKSGAVAGSVITSGISGAAVGSIAGPWGALAGAAVGLVSGFMNMESAANAYVKAQNDSAIEEKSLLVEKSLEQLASASNITATDLGMLGANINQLITLSSQNRQIISEEASGGFTGSVIRARQRSLLANASDYLFGTNLLAAGAGGGFDVATLSRNLLSESQSGILATQKSITLALEKGLDLDQFINQSNVGSKRLKGVAGTQGLTELDRNLALINRGSEITNAEARLEERLVQFREGNATAEQVASEEQTVARKIQEGSQAQKALFNTSRQTALSLKSVAIEMNIFEESIKNLAASTIRANAEFEESSRQTAIATGPGLGDTRIVGPSRLNEDILTNMRAYSQDELVNTIDKLSQKLGFSPEFTKQATTAAVAQQTLERDLPNILLQAAQDQQTGAFDADTVEAQIIKIFDPIQNALKDQIDPTTLSNAIKEISEKLAKETQNLQGKSFEQIAQSVPELASIIQPLTKTTAPLADAQKSYNDMLNATNNEMNAFTNHIGRILDLQIQASTIQLDAANNLKQALGEGVSVADLNKPFESMIDTLTSTQGPNGLVRGTGTLDPAEIARRLSQADKELVDAQRGGQKPDETLDDFYNRITKAKTTVDRLSKAQEMLANNTTKAANALNRIRELRQAQESRRNTFDDVLKNINNPEWIMNFADQVDALTRVQGGAGNINDIPLAMEALERKIAGMDPMDQKAERDKFYNNALEILKKAGIDPAVLNNIKGLIGVGGPDARMNEAIGQYNEAIKAQTDATLFMADRMESSSDIFFNTIIDAAEAFLRRVREGTQVQLPPGMGVDNNPIGNVVASTGGLIYANKGRLINFQPKGTDTVPAMLTPGEFVVNAKSTKKNIGLLKAINGNTQSSGMSKGGVVYLQDGGQVEKSKKLFGELMASSEGNSGYYSELDPEAIFKDLRATGERPLGYSALSTEDASLVDMAINNFISTYEKNRTSGIDAKREQLRQARAESAAALTKIKMDELKEAINAGIVSETSVGATLGPNGYDLSTARSLTADEKAKLRQSKLDKQSSEIDRLALIRQQESQKLLNELSQQKEEARSREELNAKAKLETNPLTNKPYSSLNEKEAVEARIAHDEKVKAQAQQIERQKLEERRRRFPDVPWAEPKTAADVASIEAGTNPGVRKAADAIEYFKNDPMFKDYRYDPWFVERIEGIIRDKYSDDLSYNRSLSEITGKQLPPVSPDQLLSLVRRSYLDYSTNIRRRQDAVAKSENDFANKNVQTALQQFGEGVDKSPILATVTAVPKNVANVGRTIIGGGAIVGGAITQGAGKLTGNDFVEELGKNIVVSGTNQAGMGVEGIRQVGAGLGSRLGFGEAYDTAEQEAIKRREALINQEVARASGAYQTDNRTTLGNLLTPENVVRGSITTGDVLGEAIGDIGGEKLFTRFFPKAFKRGVKTPTKQTGPKFTRAMQDQIDAEASEAVVSNIIGGAKLAGKVAAQAPRAIGKGVQSLFGMAKGVISQPTETVSNMLRNRSTMKWFQDLQKRASSSGSDALNKLLKSAQINRGMGQGSSQWMNDFGQQTQEYVGNLISKGKAAFGRGRASVIKQQPQMTPMKTGSMTIPFKPKSINEIALSAKVKKYVKSIPQSQKDAFEALSRNVNPEKQEIFLRDILEKASTDELKWLEEPSSFSGHLDKVADKFSQYYKQRGLPDTSDQIKKARGIFTKKNSLVTTNPVIGVAPGAGLSTGVHESTHFAADMVGKLNMKYGELKDIVGSDLLESFLDTDYNDIVKSLNTAYNSRFVRNPDSVSAGAEFFTTLNQAASDPKTKDIFAKSTKAQEILKKLWEAHGYNKGGKVVYASNGTLVPYQPKGTDTVPAMLTPGEFVVNAKATKKNLGLLKAINGGAKGYAKGGVAYLEEGGVVDDDQRRLEEILTTAKNDKDAFFYTMKEQIFDSYGLTGMVRIGPDGKENIEDDWMYQVGKEYGANQMGSDLWKKLAPDEQKRIALEHKAYFDQKIEKLSEEARREKINGKTGMAGQDFRWTDTETYKKEKAEAESRVANYQREIDGLRQKIATKKQEAGSVTQPQVKAKNEAQAQQAEQKDKPQEAPKPMLSDAAKKALDDIKMNKNLLMGATFASDAITAKDGFSRALNDLSKEGFTINTDSISDILSAAEDQILEIRNNQLAQLENFYDNNIVPVLGDLANQVGAQPSQPPAQQQPDPYAGMNQRQRMLAMRKAEYEASQQAKREAFRTRTGRDPNTGRIGGTKAELTPKEKADNKRRAQIRATREALGAKAAWVYDEETKDWKYTLTDEEANRLASADVEFGRSLSPEQIKNRKRAERLASMSRGLGGYYGDTEENRSLGLENKPYGAPRKQAEFVSELSPDQIANRERSEKLGLLNLQERSAEQQEKLDILRTPINERTPEQIARLEELRKERSEAIYASKGRLINYQPRGTDTVPAMLTPGEFVVNRKATKNNLNLLKTINSGNYNTGGIVNPLYLQGGTSSSGSSSSPVSLNGVSIPLDTGSFDSGVDKFGSSIDQLTGVINQFVSGGSSIANALAGFSNVASAFTTLSTVSSLLSGTTSGLTSAISQFNSSVTRMSESLSSIPDTISLNITGAIPVNVTVTVNGGEGLDEKLSSFEDAIYNEIASEMARATAGKNQIKLNFSTTRK